MSKSNATYTPRPDSLPSIVIGYFTNNPGEELTLEDITAKFETPRNNIHTNPAMTMVNTSTKLAKPFHGRLTLTACTVGMPRRHPRQRRKPRQATSRHARRWICQT